MTKQEIRDAVKRLDVLHRELKEVSGIYEISFHEMIKDWRLRCSAIQHVVTHRAGLSEAQKVKFNELSTRKADAKKGDAKPLTDKMQETLDELIAKKNVKDVLPKGAIAFIDSELDRILYEIDENVNTKEMEKGTIVEPNVLKLVQDVYNMEQKKDVYLEPNFKRESDIWISGEIDSEHNDSVIECKAPFTIATFRSKEDADEHYWQAQGYCYLKKKKRTVVAYGLVDAPDHLIQSMTSREMYLQGVIDPESEEGVKVAEMVEQRMTFEHKIPKQKRLKCFHIEKNKEDQEFMVQRAIMCKIAMYERAIERLSLHDGEIIVGEL